MKRFARFVRCAAILVLWVPAGAFGQVPYQRPQSPPEPKRAATPLAGNHLRKIVPKQKFAPPGPGQRGAGMPKKRARKMMSPK